MKNPFESSVVSRSQSETNADKGKMQLALDQLKLQKKKLLLYSMIGNYKKLYHQLISLKKESLLYSMKNNIQMHTNQSKLPNQAFLFQQPMKMVFAVTI